MGHLGSKHVKHIRGWLSSQQAHPEGFVKPAAPCLVVVSPSRDVAWMWRVWGAPGHWDPRSTWPPQSVELKRSARLSGPLHGAAGSKGWAEHKLSQAPVAWGRRRCHGWGSSLLLHLMHLEERGFWAAPLYQGVLLRARARPHGAAAQKVLWGSERSTMMIQHFK